MKGGRALGLTSFLCSIVTRYSKKIPVNTVWYSINGDPKRLGYPATCHTLCLSGYAVVFKSH
jgi:hypothetical protein